MDSPTTLDETLSALCLVACLASMAGGCLIPSKPTECSRDSQCQETYGLGSYCTENGVCGERSRNQMLSSPCDFGTAGPAFEQGTRHIGVILKMTDPGSSELIEPVKRAIDLAINDINTKGGVDGHQYAAIYCDNKGKDERAMHAAKHLADLGVHALIGPGFSSHTLELAPKVLIPNDILTITPSATSPQISGLDDKNLVWRTVPSDVKQGDILTKLVKRLQTEKQNQNFGGVASGDKAKLGMSTRNKDAYAQGLRNAVITGFDSSFLQSDHFFNITHPNPGLTEGTPNFGDVGSRIANNKPDVMMVWGIDEFWSVIEAAHVSAQSSSPPSPLGSTIFIGADGAKRSTLAAQVAKNTDGLDGRIWGTAPGTPNPDNYPPYQIFQVNWNTTIANNSKFGNASNHAFISYAYDATYLIALASAAAGEFTGPAMAEAMNRVTSSKGQEIAAKQGDFRTGVTQLSSGKSIQFRGASGPIQFDDQGDPKQAVIELWCYQDSDGQDGAAHITSPTNLLQADSNKFKFEACDFPNSSSN